MYVCSCRTNRQYHEARAKKLRRFHLIGNSVAFVLLTVAVSDVLSGYFLIFDGVRTRVLAQQYMRPVIVVRHLVKGIINERTTERHSHI